jgi:ActR/RegA family two-component response regulator
MEAAQQTWPIPQDNTPLIVDDDCAFSRLARAMETRG